MPHAIVARHALAAAALAITVGSLDRWVLRRAADATPPDTVWRAPEIRPLTDWSMVDHTGRPVDERLFVGRWSLVLVGFTSCPDVCPAALTALADERDGLDDVQRVFLAVDAPDDLAAYVGFFDRDLVGLQATGPALQHALDQLGATAVRRADGGFDHSTSGFVVDPHARVVAHVLHPTRGGVGAAMQYLRDAPVPGLRADLSTPARPGDMGVVYGTLHNPGPSDQVITGVSAPDYREVTLHETLVDDGIGRMRPMDALTVPAGGTVDLAPGGDHIMLHGRRRPDGHVLLTLQLATGATTQVGAIRR
jgi:copper(I)-binding protein